MIDTSQSMQEAVWRPLFSSLPFKATLALYILRTTIKRMMAEWYLAASVSRLTHCAPSLLSSYREVTDLTSQTTWGTVTFGGFRGPGRRGGSCCSRSFDHSASGPSRVGSSWQSSSLKQKYIHKMKTYNVWVHAHVYSTDYAPWLEFPRIVECKV